jgi:hypothetical protein
LPSFETNKLKGIGGIMNKKYRDVTPEICVLESQILDLADFTDVDATGTIVVTDKLPAGAVPLACKTEVLTAFSRTVSFTGDPTTLSFGDGDGAASADTIADSASGFVTDGFLVGDEIVVTGSDTNDMTVTLTAVAAGLLTFAAASVTTDSEAGVADMTIVGTATVAGTLEVGVATDTDRFTEDTTGDVATAGTIGSSCISTDACDGIGTSQELLVTVSETTDFSHYTHGALKVELFYIKTDI